jgi:DNA-binding winged helix-turn-helix (wHTH) protein
VSEPVSNRGCNPQVVRFGAYEVELRLGELRKNGVRIKLTGQPFQILVILLECPGELVTREQLQRRLWPSDTFVDFDSGLNAAVNRVREALGDSADNPRFVQTLPRRGYRFIGQVDGGLLPRNVSAGHPWVDALAHGRTKKSWRWLRVAALLILVALSLWFYSGGRRARSVPSPRLVPFTSSPGIKDRPSFSPDGKEIAFVWQGENSKDGSAFHIYVQMLGTGSRLQLTRAQGSNGSPVWSPDGRFIAFTRESSEGSNVYIVPALGGPERKVAPWYEERFGSGLSWSRDGKYLAVADCGSEKGSTGSISYISADSGERIDPKIRLPGPFVTDPVFSPDGKYLAFVSGPGFFSSDVFIVPIAGGKARALTAGSCAAFGRIDSADGGAGVGSSCPR